VLVGAVAERLKVLLTEKAAEMGATLHAMEVMPDHVHLFVESDPMRAPANIAAQFKGYTSRVLRQEFASLRSRLPTLWSRSYFASTVGYVSEATVKRYIETQWERA
jgi:putative transposase